MCSAPRKFATSPDAKLLHKSCCSHFSVPYFHAMFTHDMLESKQDVITIGTECGVEPTALEALLNFSYTGKLIINSANVRSLMLSGEH